jgi:hypothetical protein
MKTEIGEYIVGAYLKIIKECDFVEYNVRPSGGGLRGLNELDVIGLDFKNNIAYMCEVTTHIRGVLYKNNEETVSRINKKFITQKKYAEAHLSNFKTIIFMFWSPVVPVGHITRGLNKIEGLEIIINKKYTDRINELRAEARIRTNDMGNPFFRVLQILERLRT